IRQPLRYHQILHLLWKTVGSVPRRQVAGSHALHGELGNWVKIAGAGSLLIPQISLVLRDEQKEGSLEQRAVLQVVPAQRDRRISGEVDHVLHLFGGDCGAILAPYDYVGAKGR